MIFPKGTPGRRESLSWNVGLFLLPGPTFTRLPTVAERRAIKENGYGNSLIILQYFTVQSINQLALLNKNLLFSGTPVDDAGKEKVSRIQLNWTLADFKQFICQSFPDFSLNLTGYELAKADRGKNIKKVQFTSVKELKRALGRSRLYIIPLAELSQVCNCNNCLQ